MIGTTQSIVHRTRHVSTDRTIVNFTSIAKSSRNLGIRNREPNERLFGVILRLASRYRTGASSEALTSSHEISNLAKEVLSESQYNHAIRLSIMLVSSKSVQRSAIEELVGIVAPPPKRPMSYAQHEMTALPRWTSDAIRYLGDYVDLVCRHLAYERLKVRLGNVPLGKTIQLLEARRALPDNVIKWLKDYNQFLYRPGKHDFTLPEGRTEHRFTSQETVLTAFVTPNLVELLKQYSNCNPETTCHHDS